MKTHAPFRILRLKHIAVLISMIATMQLSSQTIATSQATFVLTPPGELAGSTAARSAKRVAELAISAMTNDAEKIVSDQKDLQNRIEDYDSDNKKYDRDLARYDQELNAYDSNLTVYENELSSYDRDLAPHDAAVSAYNALAPESRDEGTYNQLMSSKNRLDNWLSSLDAKKAVLDSELSVLNGKKATLDMAYNDLNQRYNQLNYEQNALDIKMGDAYRQLEQLHKYAIEINKLLERWQEPIINTYNLNTPLEQLKALSNKGWN